MHPLKTIVAILLCIGWIMVMNTPIGGNPAMGKLLDPVKGFWANAVNEKDQQRLFIIPQQKQIKILLDERLVPHIQAADDSELYYAQGYLHAWYRLWQMDMQTRAAAGRLSEVAGEKALDYDINQRRKGMIWAAENSLKAMEAVPETKTMLDAYTRGVNDFIGALDYKDLPLEYKLMGFKPERWTNLKCALLLKYMADDLTGASDDIAMSYLRTQFSQDEIDYLFPDKIEGGIAVIPAGTAFQPPSQRVPAVPSGKIFADFDSVAPAKAIAAYTESREQQRGKGSNNWVLNGSRTNDGAAILCNDPHLGLNLPSIWYEVQLSSKDINCYGVSIPGAPGVVIGFNDSISWGFTNNYRDVKDYYEIYSEDDRLYTFDGKQVPFNQRIEKIFIKDQKEPVYDTVRFTIHGPVVYDEQHPDPLRSGKKLAMTWMAHRPTNELLSLYKLNRAGNYRSFVDAIQYFECPAQNFIYADRQNNIAIWGQGRFINKWKDQGKYVMRGDISATLWGNAIPMNENPHAFNPTQNYLASANQHITDNTYPYWYNGDFSEFRSRDIHHFLNDSNLVTMESMQALQNNNFTIVGQDLNALFTHYASAIMPEKNKQIIANWNNNLDAQSKAATMFQLFNHFVYKSIWFDEFGDSALIYPSPEITVQLLTRDTNSRFFDNIKTPQRETLTDIVKSSVQQTLDSFDVLEASGKSEWYKVKNTSVNHLAKIKAFSLGELPTGGWGTAINAMKGNHGPSWRMVVKMGKDNITANVVYPGGQSGNPASKYYSNFIDNWVSGKYYTAQFIPRAGMKSNNPAK